MMPIRPTHLYGANKNNVERQEKPEQTKQEERTVEDSKATSKSPKQKVIKELEILEKELTEINQRAAKYREVLKSRGLPNDIESLEKILNQAKNDEKERNNDFGLTDTTDINNKTDLPYEDITLISDYIKTQKMKNMCEKSIEHWTKELENLQ